MTLSDENQEKIIGAMRRMDVDQLRLVQKYAYELAQAERKRINREVLSEIRVGMRVIINADVRPKYLGRQLGTVEEIKDSRISVKLDRGPQGKFRSGRVLMPASACTIIQNQPPGV